MRKTIRHLLPKSRAFAAKFNSNVEHLFNAIGDSMGETRDYIDGVYNEKDPAVTGSLDEWEAQFSLKTAGYDEATRRALLAATWQATGGQSPKYIQDTLRAAGFNVYLHEWWVPGTEPPVGVHRAAEARNPNLYLAKTGYSIPGVDCGEEIAACGEPEALCGNTFSSTGVPLVNKILETVVVDGVVTDQVKIYEVPTDPELWRYFVYLGGQEFGQFAYIDETRRDEFEELVLKIMPLHLWVGLLVQYREDAGVPPIDPCGENYGDDGGLATGYEHESVFYPYNPSDLLVYLGTPPDDGEYISYVRTGPIVAESGDTRFSTLTWRTNQSDPQAAYKTFTFRIYAVKNPRALQLSATNLPSAQELTTNFVTVDTSGWTGANPTGYWTPQDEAIDVSPVVNELLSDPCWVSGNYVQFIVVPQTYADDDGFITGGSNATGEPPTLDAGETPVDPCGENLGDDGVEGTGQYADTSFQETEAGTQSIYIGESPTASGVIGVMRVGPVVASIGATGYAHISWSVDDALAVPAFGTMTFRIRGIKDPRAGALGVDGYLFDETLTTAYVDVSTADWPGIGDGVGEWTPGAKDIDVTSIVEEIVASSCWVSGNFIQFALEATVQPNGDEFITFSATESGEMPAFEFEVGGTPPVEDPCGVNYGANGTEDTGQIQGGDFEEVEPGTQSIYIGETPSGGPANGVLRVGPVTAAVGATGYAAITWHVDPANASPAFGTMTFRIYGVANPRAGSVGGSDPWDLAPTFATVNVDTSTWAGASSGTWTPGPEVIDVTSIVEEIVADPCWVSGNFIQFYIVPIDQPNDNEFVTFSAEESGTIPAFEFTVGGSPPEECPTNYGNVGSATTGQQYGTTFETSATDSSVYIGTPPGQAERIGYWRAPLGLGANSTTEARIIWNPDSENAQAARGQFTFRVQAVKSSRAAQLSGSNLITDQVLTDAYVDVSTITWPGSHYFEYWVPTAEAIDVTAITTEVTADPCYVEGNFIQFVFTPIAYQDYGDNDVENYISFSSYALGSSLSLDLGPAGCTANNANTGSVGTGYQGTNTWDYWEPYWPGDGMSYVGRSPSEPNTVYIGNMRLGPIVANVGDTVSASITWNVDDAYAFQAYKVPVMRIYAVKNPRGAALGSSNLPSLNRWTDTFIEYDLADWPGSSPTDYWMPGNRVLDVSAVINELLADPCWVSGNFVEFIFIMTEYQGAGGEGYITYNGAGQNDGMPTLSYTVL